MSQQKKGKSFTYIGGLDSVTVYLPIHTINVKPGEPFEVCAEDASALKNHANFQETTGASVAATETAEEAKS
jgi:hypothetical protein